MVKAPGEHHTHALTHQDSRQKLPGFKGIRLRKWGSWGSEIRMPKTRAKIWLGSYKSAEQAARAYDAALYCLRDPNAKFNFPNSVPSIPSAFSLSPHQIQLAAARYARDKPPSVSPFPHNNNNNTKNAREREEASLASPSRSSSVSETELRSDREQISEERAFWESLFDGSGCFNFDNFPSTDDTCALDFIPTWEEEEQHGYISLDLWNY